MNSKLELSTEVTYHILKSTNKEYKDKKGYLETLVRENANNPIIFFNKIDNLLNSVGREITKNLDGKLYYQRSESIEFEPDGDSVSQEIVSNLSQIPNELFDFVSLKLKNRDFESKEDIIKELWINNTIYLNSNFKYNILLMDIKDQLREDNQTEYLIYLKSLSERIVTNDSLNKKLKWLGKPTDLCYIITKLSELGYIEFPQTQSHQNDLVHIINALNKMFEIDVSTDTLKKYFGSAKTEDVHVKFNNAINKIGNSEKEILKIPSQYYLV